MKYNDFSFFSSFINTELFELNNLTSVTSPSSVECFFNQYKWKDNYKAIVIGKTTAKYLPKEVHYTISSETSIDVCINLAQQSLF